MVELPYSSQRTDVVASRSRRAWGILSVVAVAFSAIVALVPSSPIHAAYWALGSTFGDGDFGGGAQGIDIDPNTDDVLVLSYYDGKVFRYQQDGTKLAEIGDGPGTGPGQMNGPGDVAVAPNGDIFVTDRGNTRVLRYSSGGTFLNSFGNNSVFSNPLGVAVDAQGNPIVADIGNGTVRKFSPTGALLQSYSLGTSPFGVGIDPDGNLWVASSTGVVRKADTTTGAILATITIGGSAQATDLDFDANNQVHIANFNTGEILTYTLGGAYVDSVQAGGASNVFRVAVAGSGKAFVTVRDFVQTLIPPGPIDTDSDGIPDDLDLDPSTPSAAFADGSGSSGQVLSNETGAPVTLIDLPDPDGVRIITGGSTGQATVKVCGNYMMQVPAASDISMTCGSLTVSVAQGGPLVISPGGDGVVTITIPGGVTARLSTLVQDEFTLDHLGGAEFITVRHPSEKSDYTWPAPKTTQLGAGDSRTFKDNADPVVNRIFLDEANVEIGEMLTLTAPFSDVGVNDVHTCVVYWEPNVESPGTITADTCTATHVYTGLGVYYPYVVVRDGDGGSGTRDATVVVYDPDTYWTLDPAGPFLEGVGGGDIAVDPNTGDVWVAGYLRNGSGKYPSVVRLSPNGDLEVEIAGCSCGTPGLVNNPIGVAVGPTGDAYVIDYGNNRVKQFAANGAFVRSFASRSASHSTSRRMQPATCTSPTAEVATSGDSRHRVPISRTSAAPVPNRIPSLLTAMATSGSPTSKAPVTRSTRSTL